MSKALGSIAYELRRKLMGVRQVIVDRKTDNILIQVADGRGFNITRKALDAFTIDEIMKMIEDARLRPWSEVIIDPLDTASAFDA